MVWDGWRAQIAVTCVKFLVLIYDIISFPIYFIIDKPWYRWKLKNIIWAKLEDTGDPFSCYVRQVQRKSDIGSARTMDQLFTNAVAKHGDKQCYGVRKVLGEEQETKSGKTFVKLNLGDYEWFTFNEANRRVEDIGKGLLSLGVKSKKPIIILAETRLEWILTAQACFRINVPVVTLYATLGEEGMLHGINQSEVSHIVTSSDLLPKLKGILSRAPLITHLIYMEAITGKPVSTECIPENMNVVPFTQLEENGKTFTDVSYTPPDPDDLAILMYTSGSTGVPKGVMVTHKNVVTTVCGFDDISNHPIWGFQEKDTYVAYLPQAHVMELAAECFTTSLGIRIGFSSPQTLTDFSTAVKKGDKGDLKVLKPSLMITVPLMLDRIRKSILFLAGKEGTFTRLMFDFAINYKKFWSEKGFRTPRLDKKLLKTYRDFMGGQLRIMISGSAPLSPDTQSFIRSCLNVQVLQGYGLTESAASATIMDFDDYSCGRVGAPLSVSKFRLVDWEEGNYHVRDKPNPRGEIVLGGDALSMGYFKNTEQTQECFKFEGGSRWFYTGDIGEVFPNGTVKIIDRKKDLVKLQFGEYIALGKVEAELKTYPLIENICVFGNGLQTYLVAIVVPNPLQLKALAKDIGKGDLSLDEMCQDNDIIQEASNRIQDHGRKCNLFGSELPKKFKFSSDEWTPESGLVTAAFKVRRKFVEQHYQAAITRMYSEGLINGHFKMKNSSQS